MCLSTEDSSSLHIKTALTLLFKNNGLLFYPLFSQKLSVPVSNKVVSSMRDSTASKSLLQKPRKVDMPRIQQHT